MSSVPSYLRSTSSSICKVKRESKVDKANAVDFPSRRPTTTSTLNAGGNTNNEFRVRPPTVPLTSTTSNQTNKVASTGSTTSNIQSVRASSQMKQKKLSRSSMLDSDAQKGQTKNVPNYMRQTVSRGYKDGDIQHPGDVPSKPAISRSNTLKSAGSFKGLTRSVPRDVAKNESTQKNPVTTQRMTKVLSQPSISVPPRDTVEKTPAPASAPETNDFIPNNQGILDTQNSPILDSPPRSHDVSIPESSESKLVEGSERASMNRIKELEQKIEQLTIQALEKDEELRQAKEDTTIKEENMCKMTEAILKYKQQCETYADSAINLKRQRESLEQELIEHKFQLNEFDKIRTSNESTHGLKTQVTSLETANCELQKQLEHINRICGDLQIQVQSAQAKEIEWQQIQYQRDENEAQQVEKLISLQHQLEQLQQATVSTQATTINDEMSDTTCESSMEMNAKIQELMEENSKLRADSDSMRDKLEVTIHDLESRLVDAEALEDTLSGEAEKNKLEIERLNSQVNEVASSLATAQTNLELATNAKLQAEIALSQKSVEVEDLVKQLEVFSEKLHQQGQLHDGKVKEIQEQHELVIELEQALKESDVEKKYLEEKWAQQNEHNKDLEEKLVIAEKNLQVALARGNDINAKEFDTIEQLTIYKTKILALGSSMDQFVADCMTNTAVSATKLDKAEENIKQILAHTHEDIIQQEKVKRELASLSKEFAASTEEVISLRNRVTELKSEIASYEKTKLQQDEDQCELNEKIRIAENELTEAMERQKMLEKEVASFPSIEASFQIQLEETSEQLEKEKVKYELSLIELKKLQGAWENSKNELDAVKVQMQDATAEGDRVSETKIKQLQEEVVMLSEKCQDGVQLRQEYDQLRSELGQRAAVIESYTIEASEFKMKIQSLEEIIAELEAKHATAEMEIVNLKEQIQLQEKESALSAERQSKLNEAEEEVRQLVEKLHLSNDELNILRIRCENLEQDASVQSKQVVELTAKYNDVELAKSQAYQDVENLRTEVDQVRLAVKEGDIEIKRLYDALKASQSVPSEARESQGISDIMTKEENHSIIDEYADDFEEFLQHPSLDESQILDEIDQVEESLLPKEEGKEVDGHRNAPIQNPHIETERNVNGEMDSDHEKTIVYPPEAPGNILDSESSHTVIGNGILVIHLDGAMIHVGHSSNSSTTPTHSIPAIVAVPKGGHDELRRVVHGSSYNGVGGLRFGFENGYFIGKDAIHVLYDHPDPALRGILKEESLFYFGEIKSYFYFEIFLNQIFQLLGIESNLNNYTLLLIHKPSINIKEKEKIIKFLFDTWNFQRIGLKTDVQMNLRWMKRNTGLLVDIGIDTTYIVPMYEDMLLEDKAIKLSIGSDTLIHFMVDLLLSQDCQEFHKIPIRLQKRIASIILMEHGIISNDYQSMINQYGSFQRSNIQVLPNNNLNKWQRDEKLIIKKNNSLKKLFKYSLPNGNLLEMNIDIERFIGPELLFSPTLDPELNCIMGLNEAIIKSILDCENGIHCDLVSNIICTGDISCLPGFQSRLQDEIGIYFSSDHISIKIIPSNKYPSYSGGIDYANHAIESMWIHFDEYTSNEMDIIHGKCH